MRQRIPTVDTVAFNNVELGITEKKTVFGVLSVI